MEKFLGLPVGRSWAPGERPTFADQIAAPMAWLIGAGLGLGVLAAAARRTGLGPRPRSPA